MCYWLDKILRVDHIVGMEWMSIKEERIYRGYIEKGVRQHNVPSFLKKLPRMTLGCTSSVHCFINVVDPLQQRCFVTSDLV